MLSADDIETVSVGGLFGDVVVVVHGSGGVLVVRYLSSHVYRIDTKPNCTVAVARGPSVVYA
jgi:alpha-beta hydrolase superfamily lysophospholipase